jgi:hypothetical protein
LSIASRFDGGDVVARNDAALDGFAEGEALAAFVGVDAQFHVGELPGAAGLLAMAVVDFGGFRYRLAVDRARRPVGDRDVKHVGQGPAKIAQVHRSLGADKLGPGPFLLADLQAAIRLG